MEPFQFHLLEEDFSKASKLVRDYKPLPGHVLAAIIRDFYRMQLARLFGSRSCNFLFNHFLFTTIQPRLHTAHHFRYNLGR
jgi:hypothetical protein